VPPSSLVSLTDVTVKFDSLTTANRSSTLDDVSASDVPTAGTSVEVSSVSVTDDSVVTGASVVISLVEMRDLVREEPILVP